LSEAGCIGAPCGIVQKVRAMKSSQSHHFEVSGFFSIQEYRHNLLFHHFIRNQKYLQTTLFPDHRTVRMPAADFIL
jgi:hypothetical protein